MAWVVTALEEGWARDWEVFAPPVMQSLLPISWVVAEQAEDHASRCHRMNLCFAGSE